MKYYSIVSDKESFGKYIIADKKHFALIRFDDDDKYDVFRLERLQQMSSLSVDSETDGILSQLFFGFVGEDGVLYHVDMLDFDQRKIKRFSLRKLFKLLDRYDKSQDAVIAQADSIRKNYKENALTVGKSFITNYKNCLFTDKNNAVQYPFRLRTCSLDDKKPLFVYLHGAGSLGRDNLRPLAEYFTQGIKLKRDECHVLIPQCRVFSEDNLSTIYIFTRSLRSLIELLCRQYNIDKNRIYISGISFGGACVWYSIYNNPGFYAGAIPLMGYMPEIYSRKFDTSRFDGANIWSSHASNDKVVSAKDDIELYRLLKNNGCNIKFTEYKKYGHKSAEKFYKKQPWKDWLFAQKKSFPDKSECENDETLHTSRY